MVSSNQKDIVTKHEAYKQWLSHPIHFVQCSQVCDIVLDNIQCK